MKAKPPSGFRRALCAALILLTATQLPAQVFEKVFSFTDAFAERLSQTSNRGRAPLGALLPVDNGAFYGTTIAGGASEAGTVFRLNADGTINTLVDFTGTRGNTPGTAPSSALTRGPDGNLYGTTLAGGTPDQGTIFRLTPGGIFTSLVTFTPGTGANRGANPDGALYLASDGNLYGTTANGGTNDFGTFFKLTTAGVITTLFDFTGTAGAKPGDGPNGTLVEGPNGSFYGVTAYGGIEDYGTVFKVTAAGALTTLVQFTVNNTGQNRGGGPIGPLTLASDGNFYGATTFGGTGDHGTLFRVTPAGAITTLFDFPASLGILSPSGGLVEGPDGTLYGVTEGGGTGGHGTAFTLSTAGIFTTLFEFTGTLGPQPGHDPRRGLVRGSDGRFYGLTLSGGANDTGVVYRISPSGQYSQVASFDQGNLGRSPETGLAQTPEGDFLGTTTGGGPNESGTIFRLTPGGVYTKVIDFVRNTGPTRGSAADTRPTLGSDGNYYGCTSGGGAYDYGTLYRLSPSGAFTVLYDFNVGDPIVRGLGPIGAIVEGGDGYFYGTTPSGGTDDCGTIFRFNAAGVVTTVIDFTGAGGSYKGAGPSSGLFKASDGNLYGTTSGGGATENGTLFQLTPSGQFTTLVEFTFNGTTNKGNSPVGSLIEDASGNLLGTTLYGGTGSSGTIYRVTKTGTLTTLFNLPGGNGFYPMGGLLAARDGNYYGTTTRGGTGSRGTIFRLTPAGVLTTIADFANDLDYPPKGELIEAPDGNIYGTAAGIDTGLGSVFRIVMPGAPSLFTLPARVESTSSIIFETRANPRGNNTSLILEYGSDGIFFPNVIPLASNLSGFRTSTIGSTLSDLAPGTLYYYRFRATNGSGATVSATQSASTLASPLVAALPVTNVGPTSARFNGSVNARNYSSTVVFEWGSDGNTFPNILPATPATATGNSVVPTSADVAGLPSGGTVFYRVRASSAGGTVISGTTSFSTVSVTTSAPASDDIGVTTVTFRATIDTFGRTAAVKFKYSADSDPSTIFETATQSITSNGAVEVTAQVPGLAENTAYHYRVSVEISGTETDGAAVAVTTAANQAPVTVPHIVFYNGQVTVTPFDPATTDYDPNNPNSAPSRDLKIDPTLVTPPQVSASAAGVTGDQRSIIYNPQDNDRSDDSFTYRIVDPLGASATGTFRLLSFRTRAGAYDGTFTDPTSGRQGRMTVLLDSAGNITGSSRFTWSGGTGLRIKGAFDLRGQLTRSPKADTSDPDSATLVVTLSLDPDTPVIRGSFAEISSAGPTTASVPSFTLTKNGASGGLASSGIRTAFIPAPTEPAELATATSDGYLIMTVGKDARRQARIAGRLPDGEPFLLATTGTGHIYPLIKNLERSGSLMAAVRVIDPSAAGSGGILSEMLWRKSRTTRGSYYAGGINTTLPLLGTDYTPAPGNLPPIDLAPPNAITGNARLRFQGGGLGTSYRDVLVNVLPTRIQIIAADPAQTGPALDPRRIKLTYSGAQATFTGSFANPTTGKPIPFDGTFRRAFDTSAAQGRGQFRPAASAPGTVQILAD